MQMNDSYKTRLHSKIHWLLVYKEQEDEFDNLNEYFESVIEYLKSLGMLFPNTPDLVELMVTVQRAYNELTSSAFSFKKYRKHILDAHSIIDRL